MKPTPTSTHCPPPGDLRRLLLGDLPDAEAAQLREHLRDCTVCRALQQQLQTETVAGHTPPILHPAGDTNPGKPAPSSSVPAVAWSSEVMLVGGGERVVDPPRAPSGGAMPTFSFLEPAREAGEIGWLGNYRITGILGEGGMGFVFDAFDTHLQRRVALKVLKPELAANLSFRERFLQEARVAAALPDDYIITIYQVGMEHDVPFLAMKFLHGESLEQAILREGRIPTSEVLRIGREIALGLSAAHDRGLIHRDIKPANLWLETQPPEQETSSGTRLSCEYVYRVKVLDFGLARPVKDARRLTATGLIVGTPSYLAPEQARGQPLDHRCDLFAFGCVLYRMVTGVLPFDGPDTMAQLTALAVTEPRPIERLAADVPVGLRNLIHQLLAREPADRPATARAVAEALRALEKGVTPAGEFASLLAPPRRQFLTAPPSGRSPAYWRWLAACGVVAVVLFGGLLLWDLLRPTPADPSATISPESKEPIKVGILFSQRGSMGNGGRAAADAAQLAIDELNQQGGLLGRRIEALVGDGESDYRKFAELAEKFIDKEGVCVLFGTRASSNRKAVKPIVEKYQNLLLYPMQFEGLEASPNIVYLGTTPNQQMFPAVDFMLGSQRKRRIFLIGSDYIFPRAANALLRDHIREKYPEVKIVGETYIPFGGSDVQDAVRAIAKAEPDLILNTINGDSNSPFFRDLLQQGVRAKSTPVLSFSLAENDLLGLGEAGVGHYAAWSYFQSVKRPENREFVAKFHKRFSSRRVVSDPMETIYFGVHLWARAVQAAGRIEPRAVRDAIKGLSMEAPEGEVRIDRDSGYTWRVIRMGRVGVDGQFEILFNSETPLEPQPFPAGRRSRADWETFELDLYKGWGGRWRAPVR